MCLIYITKENLNETGIGWKVFRKQIGYNLLGNPYQDIRPLMYDMDGRMSSEGRIIHFHSWYQATKTIIRSYDINDYTRSVQEKKEYRTGFHCYLDIKSAIEMYEWCRTHLTKTDFIVLPVIYRKGHTKGIEKEGEVIVADEMFVCSTYSDAEEWLKKFEREEMEDFKTEDFPFIRRKKKKHFEIKKEEARV